MVDIVDLHCDLLSYLQADRSHSALDDCVRCSVSQLKAGGVRLQTMAIMTETVEGSQYIGQQQLTLFKELPQRYPSDFKIFEGCDLLSSSPEVAVILAVENASAFCGEEEQLHTGIDRLMAMQEEVGQVLYVSLTWNEENRFGGGVMTDVGLKDEGKCLLEALDDTGIAVDLSHASDRLAHDIINALETHGWEIPIMASHSNMRPVTNVCRNLSDDIAREIIARDGIIGLSLVCHFVGGQSIDHFAKHLAYLLDIGGEYHVSLGADFFWDGSLPATYRDAGETLFFDECGDASCYRTVIAMLKDKLRLSEATIARFAHRNALRRIAKCHCTSKTVLS